MRYFIILVALVVLGFTEVAPQGTNNQDERSEYTIVHHCN